MKSMKASVLRCALAFVCGVASYSCSVTRHLPPDSYMLTKNKIETDRTVPRDECITAGEIDRYVRQNPSKKLLGTNLPAWLYNQADPNKENGWNNLLRRLGSEPVILDTVQTAASNRNIKLYMDSRGFYESTSRYEIEYKRNRKAVVTYSVRQGAPYRINSLSYDYQDKFLEQVIRQDSAATLIRPGDIFDLTLLNDERQRITAYLKDRGYYKFSVNNISYIADTLAGDHLVDLTMVIRQQLEGYTPEGEPIYGNNAVYRLGKIFVYPDYDATAAATAPAYLRGMDTTYYRGLYIIRSGKPKIKPQTLRRAIPIYSDYLYSAGDKQRTSSNLQRLDYFKNASVTFSEPEPEDDNYITYIGEGGEGEAPVQTLERALDCDIFCTPAMRQGYTLDFEATTSSAFYALRPTVSYLNRNLFRGAELLNISLSGGYEFNTDETAAKNSYEVGLTASVTFPRFLAPFPIDRAGKLYRPLTRIEVSTNLQRKSKYHRTITGANIGYSWNNGRNTTYTVRPIDFNLVDVSFIDTDFLCSIQNSYLRESYKSQYIAAISGSYLFNNPNTGKGNSITVRVNAETAGNLTDGLRYGGTDLPTVRNILQNIRHPLLAVFPRGCQCQQYHPDRIPVGRGLPVLRRHRTPLRQLLHPPDGPHVLRGRQQQHARLAGESPRTGQLLQGTELRLQKPARQPAAGGQPRIPLSHLERPARCGIFRRRERLARRHPRCGQRRGFPFRQLLQGAWFQHRVRPALRPRPDCHPPRLGRPGA